jgi:phytoene dehydrogenase-like protein
MITRRNFIHKGALAATGSVLLSTPFSCTNAPSYTGSISGANAALGHRIRDGIPAQSSIPIQKEDIVIVGGGVAGLAAARWLKKAGQSFRLLELESAVGGNSRSGKNIHTAYPLGAHYLPLPGTQNEDLLDFLEECQVITGYENGRPVYNDYFLCFDPKERLFINHHWQEGLIPHEGVPINDREEIQRFLHQMAQYKELKGADGKRAFEIPLDKSSEDPTFTKLDDITMDQFLTDHQFDSPYLRWYVNYCCSDDYGADLMNTSAWAGIHYFASRDGKAANAESDDVLTWPEGNHWLTKQLSASVAEHIQENAAVTAVRIEGKKVIVDYYDASGNQQNRIEAKAAIMCTPQFLNKYILKVDREVSYSDFHYAPWMVANLTVTGALQERRGETMCWDNVIYGSQSLGYVHAQHQHLNIPSRAQVITYYMPMTHADCVAARKHAQQLAWNDWTRLVFNDLSVAHPSLEKQTSHFDVHLWGHGMIRPQPGFIWSQQRKTAMQSIQGKLFFAHSDLSGISVFEEAFEQGIHTARKLLSEA